MGGGGIEPPLTAKSYLLIAPFISLYLPCCRGGHRTRAVLYVATLSQPTFPLCQLSYTASMYNHYLFIYTFNIHRNVIAGFDFNRTALAHPYSLHRGTRPHRVHCIQAVLAAARLCSRTGCWYGHALRRIASRPAMYWLWGSCRHAVSESPSFRFCCFVCLLRRRDSNPRSSEAFHELVLCASQGGSTHLFHLPVCSTYSGFLRFLPSFRLSLICSFKPGTSHGLYILFPGGFRCVRLHSLCPRLFPFCASLGIGVLR